MSRRDRGMERKRSAAARSAGGRGMILRSALAAAVVVAAPLLFGGGAGAEEAWRKGRATFYGDRGYFSLHEGSCGFGNIDYHQGTGWDVAALPDSHHEYEGSCGHCYEVKCEPMIFKDNYGNILDRKDACYENNKTVLVTITDTCPCNFQWNTYSNKRWCCGDMDHFDLSYHAYDKLAARQWGVIGLKYRPAPCPGEKPQKRETHGPLTRLWWANFDLTQEQNKKLVQAFEGG